MSYANDITEIEKKIAAAQLQQQEIVTSYNVYNTEVVTRINSLMREAGIFDAVHELEIERGEAQKRAQDKGAELGQQINKDSVVLEFLLAKASKESPADPPAEPNGKDALTEESPGPPRAPEEELAAAPEAAAKPPPPSF